MNKNSAMRTKKVSRRDALKLLTAVAGATALANAPARWSKPSLKVGMLPAHAQTSVITTHHTLLAGTDQDINICQPALFTSTAIIAPTTSGVSLNYVITPSVGITISSPAGLSGVKFTDAAGVATLDITASSGGGGTVEVVWSFTNASDGTGSDNQVFTAGGC